MEHLIKIPPVNCLSTLLLLMVIVLNGCQSLGVEVWERDVLSQADMQFLSNDLDLTMDDHFYFSKEGTSGGRGFAGGGCGCN